MSKQPKITLAHLERAAKWAIRARKAGKATKVPGDGAARFDMRTYFTSHLDSEGCGTSCCIAGAAALIAGFKPQQANAAAGEWRYALKYEYLWMAKGGPLREALPGAPRGLRQALFRVMESRSNPQTAPERVLKIIAKIKAAKRKAK